MKVPNAGSLVGEDLNYHLPAGIEESEVEGVLSWVVTYKPAGISSICEIAESMTWVSDLPSLHFSPDRRGGSLPERHV